MSIINDSISLWDMDSELTWKEAEKENAALLNKNIA